MGGTSTADSKTTTQNLTPEQQKLAGLAGGQYEQFAASNPTAPGGASVSPFDPLQTQGQNTVLGAVGNAGDIVGGAGTANKFLTSGAALDPATNPSLKAWQDAAVRPIFDNLNETTLPQLSADASTGAGGISANLGGSRQGIAEGLATKGAYNAAGATEANIGNAGYGAGLNAMLTATGQAPGTAAAQTIPGTIQSTVGDVRQGQAQQVLTADTAAQQFQQYLPALKAMLLTQGAAGLPGGSTTSTGTSNTSANPISQLIGGASAAGGLAGGLSDLLPLLAVASDERLKENIKYLYTLPNGHRWYEYNFRGSKELCSGVMAQEARKITPSAVFEAISGLLFVNYSKILEV